MKKPREKQTGALVRTREFIEKLNKPKKGFASPTFLEIAVIIAIILLVIYPVVKSINSTIWTTIQTWFTTNIGKIFTNLP